LRFFGYWLLLGIAWAYIQTTHAATGSTGVIAPRDQAP
jgi:hypothetical protein